VSLPNSIDEQTATVGLLQHIGGGNLGDDATLHTVLASIRRRWPHSRALVFSLNPSDTEKRHDIAAYPARRVTWSFGYAPRPFTTTARGRIKTFVQKSPALFRVIRAVNTFVIRRPIDAIHEMQFLVKSFWRIRSCNILVVCGGGQLTEWGGPWGFPYTIFKWVLLARLARVKCFFLNVGAGPLLHPLSILFVKRALAAADYVSFRDKASSALLQGLGFASVSHVFPDSAYILDVSSYRRRRAKRHEDSIVGIAPMPYLDPRTFPPKKDQEAYQKYIRKLAAFSSHLAARGYSVALFGTDIGVDPLAISDVEITMRSHTSVDRMRSVTCLTAHSLSELLSQIASFDYVVTCRFHGVVFAHLLNKPVLAIAHHPKVTTLMHDLGLSDYCLDINTFDSGRLAERFESLVANRDYVKHVMAEQLAAYKQRLTDQFDELFPKTTRVA
jgi:polysaccharide pyruvyl transferase WcaK-like protein